MGIQEKINSHLAEKQKERSKREGSGKFYPSSLGKCFRCQICTRASFPPTNPPDERSLRIFKCGSLFHDFVQGFMPPNECEVLCENDDFKGYADIVNEDTVYDVKSVHSYSFRYLNKPNYDVKKEKFHNWLQLTYYAWILKKKKISLILISKDDLCMAEYVDFTDKWLEKLQAEMDELRWHWANYLSLKTLPSASPRFKGKPERECEAYCDWFDYCKGVENDEHRRHPSDKSLKDGKSK